MATASPSQITTSKTNIDNDKNEVISILSIAEEDTVSVLQSKIWKQEHSDGKIFVAFDGFGMIGDEIIKRFTFTNQNRMEVKVITYGATITSMRIPNKSGRSEEIIMGFDDISGYINPRNPQFGSTIGPFYNNRSVDNNVDKFIWTDHMNKTILILSHTFKNDKNGTVLVNAEFELKNNNSFHVRYSSICSQPTPINLTNNCYFNLAGHSAGHKELYKHVVTINADRYVNNIENNDVNINDNLPTMESNNLQCVGGTIFDLRIPRELGPAISRCPGGGYNQYLCLTQGIEQNLTFATRIVHPMSGRVLELYTNQPFIQFYTANRLPDPFDDINPNELYTNDYYELPSQSPALFLSNHSSIDDDHLFDIEENCGESTNQSGDDNANDHVVDDKNDDNFGDINENELVDQESYEEIEENLSKLSSNNNQEPIIGKKGAEYMRHGGFCLNTQNYQLNYQENEENLSNIIISPGQQYKNEIIYRFGIYRGDGICRSTGKRCNSLQRCQNCGCTFTNSKCMCNNMGINDDDEFYEDEMIGGEEFNENDDN